MEPGFIKANSSNLPLVDATMIIQFYHNHPDFHSAEMKNIKSERSTREAYGDEAIGYIQIKRVNSLCTIKARVTPEHRVHNKAYTVTVTIDENEETIISANCEDCPASSGSCKHSIAMVLWLHRRSEEPSVTSVECYWRKSKLSNVGKTFKALALSDMYEKKLPPLSPKGETFLQEVIAEGIRAESNSDLISYFKNDHPLVNLSIHNLSLQYIWNRRDNEESLNAKDFINYCKEKITAEDCNLVEKLTEKQSKSTDWYNIRYARITASKIYEATKCKTAGGSLEESIFGASKFPVTSAMKRGLDLEDSVLLAVQEQKKIICKRSGFIINKDYPIFGASPDAVTQDIDICIEIKCPSKEKTVKNYLNEVGEICPKPFAQVQMQMFLLNINKSFFCVASPNFEQDKNVTIKEVLLDSDYCNKLILEAEKYWIENIFPKLCDK